MEILPEKKNSGTPKMYLFIHRTLIPQNKGKVTQAEKKKERNNFTGLEDRVQLISLSV